MTVDFNIMVGGEAGQGVQSVGLIETFSEVALPRFGKHKLEKLFEIRNAIAHKKKASATGSEASSAIRVALELKELLHNLK